MISHLVELRSRLIKCTGVTLVAVVICLYFNEQILNFVIQPGLFKQFNTQIIATSLPSTIATPIKLAVYIAILASMPAYLYHLWMFIAPGLFPHERATINVILSGSMILFTLGILFALKVMYPVTTEFFINFAPTNINVLADFNSLVDLAITMCFAAGVAFQVPVVIYLLLKSNLISKQQLSLLRPYVIVLSFILGMLLTPPDVVSQVMLALPIWLLFEASLWLGPNPKSKA